MEEWHHNQWTGIWMHWLVGPSQQTVSVSECVLLKRGGADFSWIHYVVFGIVRELPVRILSSYILRYMDNIGVYHCLAVRYDTVNLSSVHADMLLNQKWWKRYLSSFWSILVVPWIDSLAATEEALVKILSTVNWLLHIAIWPFKKRNRIWSHVLQCNDCLLCAKWRSA